MSRYELVIQVESALLVGGYAAPGKFVDATTAVDAEGCPIIPSSTIKGALREALTRMARGEGGSGACDRDDVGCGNCMVCEFFGAPGSDIEDVLGEKNVSSGASGRISIGDARPQHVDEATIKNALRVRHGVGIDRMLRSISHEVLFEREVFDAQGIQFIAPLRLECLDDDDLGLFRNSLELVTGIGNSRSRGLGRVRMALREVEARAASEVLHEIPTDVPRGGAALVVIEVVEPMVLGGFTPTSNFLETLQYIPGSAIRGAVANAVVAAIGNVPAFQRLFVAPGTCMSFSDAHPACSQVLPVPVPQSSLACKHEERTRDHPPDKQRLPRDGLLSAALVAWLTEQHGGSIAGQRCPHCTKPLGKAHGIWPQPDVKRRVVTRLARDIHTGSAATGMLYSVTQIEPGAAFMGTVARLSAEALDMLQSVVNVPLRIGRARSRGQGAVRLRILPDESHIGEKAIEVRRERFAKSIAGALPLLDKNGTLGFTPAGALAVLARTDLRFPPASGPDELLRTIYGKQSTSAACVVAMQAPTTRSGWNEGKMGKRQARACWNP